MPLAVAATGTGGGGGRAQESVGAAVAAGATGALAPQRDGLADSPIVGGTDADGREDVPLATDRLELTPRGFFLKSLSNLSRFEYVFDPHVNPFHAIPI